MQTTSLYQIPSNQLQPAVSANENFEAVAPSGIYGPDHVNTDGLTFAYYGGTFFHTGSLRAIVSSTLLLAAATTNRVSLTGSGTVVSTNGPFTPGNFPLYEITTGNSTQNQPTDARQLWARPNFGELLTKSLSAPSSRYSLNAGEALSRNLIFHGGSWAITGDVVVPNHGVWTVINSTTGGQSLRVITNSGTGITIATGRAAKVIADGTNVLRLSADVNFTT